MFCYSNMSQTLQIYPDVGSPQSRHSFNSFIGYESRWGRIFSCPLIIENLIPGLSHSSVFMKSRIPVRNESLAYGHSEKSTSKVRIA